MITRELVEKMLRRVDSLDPKQAQALLTSLGKEIDEKCREDGLFWLKFVSTRDEADPSCNIKRFPLHLQYVRDLWNVFLNSCKVVVAKSRQMLVTWEVVAFIVWWARYHPNQAIYFQTMAWEDAVEKICMPTGGYEGRAQFIENNLPAWLKVDYKPSEGRIQYPNGSIIQALSGGADKVRGKTASIIVEDEFAHQEDQDGVYTAVAPLIQKGARAIFVSSPNGAGNTFATLYHGRQLGG